VILQVEEARAYSNLGSSHHYRRNFAQAISYHENVLRIAQELGDHAVEARAYAGLGHAARCAGDYTQVVHNSVKIDILTAVNCRELRT
jgi:tetratricopeptide (TPR) repeat protein